MATLFDLTGRTALVTGAGSGIGQRLAAGLAEQGADVSCLDLASQEEGLSATLDAIGGLQRTAISLIADVTDPSAVDRAMAEHTERLGALDIAVNCAGINSSSPAEDMTDELWGRLIDTNLTGVFVCCRAEGKVMLDRGQGSIINIASMSATIANRGLQQAHYNASKAGVKHLTASLALEWGRRGVRVNSISPGYIATAMTSGPEWEERMTQFADDTPMGRVGTPDDLVGPTVFLASDAASFTTGADLLIDGGFTKW